jgi:hypothetical protein
VRRLFVEVEAMEFKNFVGKAQELAGATAAAATATAGRMLDEFNEALPTMRALGFVVKDLHVGMGLLPEIGASLVASTDTIDEDKLQELIEKHAGKKLLVTALKGLYAAYNIKREIPGVPLNGVQLDLTLSLPPRVNVSFVNDVIAAAT